MKLSVTALPCNETVTALQCDETTCDDDFRGVKECITTKNIWLA